MSDLIEAIREDPPSAERASIIAYLERQARNWMPHNTDYARIWRKAARHVSEKRDIAETL